MATQFIVQYWVILALSIVCG